MAPIIATVLGLLGTSVREQSQAAALTIQIANGLICLTGFVLGVVALGGMKRWGRRRVLVPALIGVSIFALLIVMAISTITSLRKHRAALMQQARTAELAKLKQEGEDAFKAAGWFGVSRLGDGRTIITLTTIPDTTPFISELRSKMATPLPLIAVSVENSSGTADVTIDTTGSEVYFLDGTHEPLPDAGQVVRGMGEDAAFTRAWSPPFIVPAGQQLRDKFLFLPTNADKARIDRITLMVNGQPLDIPGRFYTAEEKAELVRRGQEAQRQQQQQGQ